MQPDVDLIAKKLLEWGAMAKRQPPGWQGNCDAPPLSGPEGEPIGWILPGKGLYLAHDLKSLGITFDPAAMARAGVYERSPVRRLAEKIAKARKAAELLITDERGAITSYDGIINARGNGFANDTTIQKNSITTVANTWSSLWQVAGLPVAGTFTSTPGVAPNNTTVGALSTGLTTPGAGSKYLLTFGFTSSSALDMVLLVDLLSQVGSLSATSNSLQTIASAALTRYTTGAGVYMTFEVTTAIGTTASNLTVTYTNQGGTPSKTTPAQAMTTSMIASRLLPSGTAPVVPLASGDYGVQQVTGVQLSAAMSAGAFALSLYKQVKYIAGIVANIWMAEDSTIQIDGIFNMPIGSDSAIGCLGAFIQSGAATSGAFIGAFQSCSG